MPARMDRDTRKSSHPSVMCMKPSPYAALSRYADQTVTLRGKMTLAKNGRLASLVVSDVE